MHNCGAAPPRTDTAVASASAWSLAASEPCSWGSRVPLGPQRLIQDQLHRATLHQIGYLSVAGGRPQPVTWGGIIKVIWAANRSSAWEMLSVMKRAFPPGHCNAAKQGSPDTARECRCSRTLSGDSAIQAPSHPGAERCAIWQACLTGTPTSAL